MSDYYENQRTDGGQTPPSEPVEAAVIAADSSESSTPWALIGGAVVLAAALVGGIWFATSGETEVDVAQGESTEEVAEPTNGSEEPDDGIEEEVGDTAAEIEANAAEQAATEEAEFAEEAMESEFFTDEMAVDSSIGYGGGISTAVFDGSQFVQLSNDGDSWTVKTSTDGLLWEETPASGLPTAGYVYQLVHQDGQFLGLVESYESGTSSQSIAASADGVNWTTTALPSASAANEAWYQNLALIDGRVLLLRNIYDRSNDPWQILLDAGVLTGELEENFCGFDFAEPGDPINLLTCDYEAEFNYPSDADLDELAARYDAAETDAERKAIEAELDALWGEETEVFMTINPGEALYDELSSAMTSEFEHQETLELVAGPVTGPFEVVHTFDQDGYSSGFATIDSAIFASFESYDERVGASNFEILTSTDGVSWSPVATPGGAQGGYLQGFGDVLVFNSYGEFGGSITHISTDGAATWTESSLGSSLYDPYSQFTSSDAGIAALTQGLVEPYSHDVHEGPEVSPVLTKDGYSLDVGWNTGVMILTGPDGVVIYELSEEDMWGGDSDAVRMNPISGAMTFLDPNTGEDLVTFTDEDWEAAYGAVEEVVEPIEWEEPAQALELHYSADGTSWTELDTSSIGEFGYDRYVSLVGIGDDEVVLSVETYNEPPEELWAFEMEGREPTDAEIEALQLWERDSSNIEYVRIPLS